MYNAMCLSQDNFNVDLCFNTVIITCLMTKEVANSLVSRIMSQIVFY